MPLDRIVGNLFQRTSPAQRAAFLACFVSGYLVHLFAFTNIIPNSDGLSRVFDPQQMTVSAAVSPLRLRLKYLYPDASPHRLS